MGTRAEFGVPERDTNNRFLLRPSDFLNTPKPTASDRLRVPIIERLVEDRRVRFSVVRLEARR